MNLNTDGDYTINAIAWIDWNQDGIFNTTDEEYELGTTTNNADGITSNSPLSIAVPAAAVSGNTRMRVSAKYASDPTACETDFDGEVEDYSINIQAACTAPDVPTLSATSTTICNGGSTTLSVSSGNLNDANHWQWYSGSCGGTTVGTGTSINVSPTSTTTYYTRGEGSCDGTTCGDITVTVNDPSCVISGNSTVCPNEQDIAYRGTTGMSIYAWSITSGDATIDGSANSENITVDAGSNNFILELTVTDAFSCSNTCNVNVTVEDNTDPVITCPANINETVPVDVAGKNVTWTLPSVSDNCDSNVELQNTNVPTLSPGDYFSVGTTTVTYRATDDSGNSSTCSFDIIVSEFDCSSQAINANGNEEWIAQVDIGSFSNSSGASNYTDFTTQIIDLDKNTNHNIILTPSFSRTSFDEYWRVWVDFNQDGDYSDSGEELFFGNSTSAINSSISIPDIEIVTTMRISMKGIHSGNDLTTPGGNVTAQYYDSPVGEEIDKLIDNVVNSSNLSKYLTFHASGWVQYQFSGGNKYAVIKYSLTSANDVEERDPYNWTLQGSNDGTTWTTIDTRTGEDFPNRWQRREFSVTNNTAYEYYRLNMTNNSTAILQIGEWELFETDDTPYPEPCETFAYGEVEDYTINIIPPCTDSDVPTITASSNPICSGDNVTLTISGNLNDAVQWRVYTGSCGGTQIGTTATSSFVVNNITTTTTYYVRGEGNCVTPGSCGSVTVTVEDTEDPTITCATPAPAYSNDGGECFYTISDNSFDPIATGDNCAIASVINDFNSANTLNGAQIPVGTTTVIWMVTDAAGNTATCQYDVVVIDDENPTITCPANVTVNPDDPNNGVCTASNVALGTPTTAYNC